MATKTVFDFNPYTARFELKTFPIIEGDASTGVPMTVTATYPVNTFPTITDALATPADYTQESIRHRAESTNDQFILFTVVTESVVDRVFIQYHGHETALSGHLYDVQSGGSAHSDDIQFTTTDNLTWTKTL